MASGEPLVPTDGGGAETQEQNVADEGAKGACCPVDMCCCLPAPIRMFVPIPTTYRILQDVTHGLLLTGMVGGLLLILEVVGGLWEQMECRPSRLPCAEEALTFISVIPCSFVLHKLVLLYDSQLAEKEAEARKHRKLLEDNYGNMIGSMEGLLSKATQSSAKMAEDNFDERRRDFQTWLRDSERIFGKVADANGSLLKQFRRFVLQWCQVFRECSIDPISQPRVIVDATDLNKCNTIGQVVAMVLERLKTTQVRFISSHREQDAKMLDSCQQEQEKIMKRYSVTNPGPRPPQLQEIELAERGGTGAGVGGGGGGGFGGGDEDGSTFRFHRQTLTVPPPMTSMASSANSNAPADAAPRGWLPCTWCTCGCFGCGRQRGNAFGGFPWELRLLCARLVILSPAHSTLASGLLFCFALITMEVLNGLQSSYVRIVSITFYMLAICNLLVCFEQIDMVQKLCSQLSELEAENQRIKERRDRMHAFWTNTQQLLDLWVHRTLPRLNLLYEVSELLEDEDMQHDLLAHMTNANQVLEDLEGRLPELALWRQDGGLPEATKKAFSGRLENICKLETLPGIMTSLTKEMDQDVLRIEGNVPTSQSG